MLSGFCLELWKKYGYIGSSAENEFRRFLPMQAPAQETDSAASILFYVLQRVHFSAVVAMPWPLSLPRTAGQSDPPIIYHTAVLL